VTHDSMDRLCSCYVHPHYDSLHCPFSLMWFRVWCVIGQHQASRVFDTGVKRELKERMISDNTAPVHQSVVMMMTLVILKPMIRTRTSARIAVTVSVGIDLKELRWGRQQPKCLKFCPGIEVYGRFPLKK